MTILILILLIFSVYYTVKSLIFNDFNNNSKNLCPASNIIDTKNDGIYSYPIDVFDLTTYNQLKIQYEIKPDDSDLDKIYHHEEVFKCTSSEISNYVINHTCSTLTTCPIISEYIDIAVNKTSSWKYKHSLCQIRNALHDPDSIINIIVVGGSVSYGSASTGCCCDPILDTKCKTIQSPRTPERCGDGDITELCRWSHYFYKWLSMKSLGKVIEINLSEGGYNSQLEAEDILTHLDSAGIARLTSTDIVFLDYSVNDGIAFYQDISKQKTLEKSLMKLIGRLIEKSTPGSWPSIILLEQWFSNITVFLLRYNKNNRSLIVLGLTHIVILIILRQMNLNILITL